MEVTDLMVGDWVVYNGDVEYTNPIKIEGIDIATDMLITSDREDVGFKGVEPIPLTAEILEGSGFDVMVYDNGDKLFAYGSLCILDHKGLLTFKISDCRKGINYVHELQHALRLCGIEKDIEL